MKANFALKLSFDGIRLLHRAAGGWRVVGEVALDDPDLDGALAALRKTALGLEPSGLRTKLVLPGTQVRYLTIDSADMTADQLQAAAESALDGATPYAVSDLVFDLSPDGDQTHIAAVARETLTEAEAFAVQHRFAPISLVTIPEEKPFLGEPFFGATEHAQDLLGPNETVEPDGIAVVELGQQEWPDGPVLDVADASPVATDESPAPATMPPDEDPPHAGPDQDATRLDIADPELDRDRSDPLGAAVRAAKMATAKRKASEDTPADVAVGFSSRRGPAAGGAPSLGGVTRQFDTSPALQQMADDATAQPGDGAAGDADAAAVGDDDAASHLGEVAAAAPESVEDDVPDPPAAARATFLSRRQARDTAGAAPAEGRADPTLASAAPAAPQPPNLVGTPETAFAADRRQPDVPTVRVPRPNSERQRMTVFGARQPEGDGTAAVGGKPRYLGLILTAFLLIFLAGVAAWAAVFVDEGLARFFGPRTPEAVVTADELAEEPEPLAPQTDAGPGIDNPQTAALDPGPVPDDVATEPGPRADPAGPPEFDPERAAEQYAETGIWAVPPEVPDAPGLVSLDNLYVTSIDPANLSFDAVALPPQPETRTDRAPLAPANPAPPGTEFELDARGLVIPTPDGAMSPDGILIHTGPPPVVPPDTPPRPDVAPGGADAAARLELRGFRPRVRPEDLVENTERRQLGGLTRTELAAYRPRLRPDTVKKAAEEDETPTAQAVASALRPTVRPGNFESIVARARAARPAPQETDDAGTAQATAAASTAQRTVAPPIPSRSSVAREATLRNAINLRRINLMGVYGSASNRRALVRLSNGRYKKLKVGDRIDGGRVSAIGDSQLSYTKGNRSIVLTMPRT